MKVIADFHIHSKYSRAVSQQMDLEHINLWSKIKGIDLVSTGDFTHPLWFGEIKQKLEPLGNGFFELKKDFVVNETNFAIPKKLKNKNQNFILTSEISNIYSENGRVRKIHNVVVVPSIETAAKVNKALANIGNLASDGRPILGLSSRNLSKIVFDIDERAMLIPAHAWTPWFSIFGSKSGFDSIEECFGDYAEKIFAIETGLSSDAAMNWRLSKLDKISLISSSDAHSPANLGREATVFNLKDFNYDEIATTLRAKDPKKLLHTIEFFPEEGKYHYDGHSDCKICFEPKQSKEYSKKCPVCKKFLTIGVLNRVDELADREIGRRLENFPDEKHIVPLAEIIADALGVGKNSKAVGKFYFSLIDRLGDEFSILLDVPYEEIENVAPMEIAQGIKLMREGKISLEPGYDGVYGKVKIFDEQSRINRKIQTLF